MHGYSQLREQLNDARPGGLLTLDWLGCGQFGTLCNQAATTSYLRLRLSAIASPRDGS
jgi:hypothetical protein